MSFFGIVRAAAQLAREREREDLQRFGPQRGRPAWEATHLHRKGGLYRELHRGLLEADVTPVVIYEDRHGNVWVRPAREFDDGRFVKLGPENKP